MKYFINLLLKNLKGKVKDGEKKKKLVAKTDSSFFSTKIKVFFVFWLSHARSLEVSERISSDLSKHRNVIWYFRLTFGHIHADCLFVCFFVCFLLAGRQFITRYLKKKKTKKNFCLKMSCEKTSAFYLASSSWTSIGSAHIHLVIIWLAGDLHLLQNDRFRWSLTVSRLIILLTGINTIN